VQCRRWSYGRVRDAQHCPRENEIRRRRRHVSDGQDTANAATGDGAERGIGKESLNIATLNIYYLWYRPTHLYLQTSFITSGGILQHQCRLVCPVQAMIWTQSHLKLCSLLTTNRPTNTGSSLTLPQ